jgi:mannosyltransferase OCH1-like enzyme
MLIYHTKCHTACRSFATNLYLEGFPTISIMAATGHKTERAFLDYIKVTQAEHAQKLIEHWEKQLKNNKKKKNEKPNHRK